MKHMQCVIVAVFTLIVVYSICINSRETWGSIIRRVISTTFNFRAFEENSIFQIQMIDSDAPWRYKFSGN